MPSFRFSPHLSSKHSSNPTSASSSWTACGRTISAATATSATRRRRWMPSRWAQCYSTKRSLGLVDAVVDHVDDEDRTWPDSHTRRGDAASGGTCETGKTLACQGGPACRCVARERISFLRCVADPPRQSPPPPIVKQILLRNCCVRFPLTFW